MKQFSFNSLVALLRICIVLLVLSLVSLFLLSFISTQHLGDEIWKHLGLNRAKGTEGIYRSFTGGYLYYYDARNATHIVAGNRLAIAKELLVQAKQYINSDQFKRDYEAGRKSAMPEKPQAKIERTIAEIQNEEIAKNEKSIRGLEKSMKEMNADMKRGLQPMLDMLKKMVNEFQDPRHQYFHSLALMDKNDNVQAVRNHEDRLQRWEKQYPSNFTPIVKERLQKFLKITEDVHFDAALKTINGKKIFVDRAFEGKPTEWKQAFRAEREITTMARAFATQWLAEIK